MTLSGPSSRLGHPLSRNTIRKRADLANSMMSKQCDTKEGGFGKSETGELFFYRVIKKDDNFDAEMARASSWEVRAMQMWGSSANTPWFHAGRPDTPNDDL